MKHVSRMGASARYADDDMPDGPMMRTPIRIISSQRALSYVPNMGGPVAPAPLEPVEKPAVGQ
jgi:hypothetical protein